jgi:hypothetical protein
MAKPYLQQFILVGGTGLSLQIGHRKSVDLDLFTVKDFATDDLVPLLSTDYDLKIIFKNPKSLICTINGIKVDFIHFKYKIIRPIVEIDKIRLASVDDIAGMKLDAITGRGKKKDFYDLFFLLKIYSLEKLFELFLEKYPHQTVFHVARSMSYFADAENDITPEVLDKKLTWEKVKKAIANEIRKL